LARHPRYGPFEIAVLGYVCVTDALRRSEERLPPLRMPSRLLVTLAALSAEGVTGGYSMDVETRDEA
jgi:hypothetical protein